MSDTITGTLEEIAIVKSGKGAKGPWTLRKITVDGEKYSTFDPVKAPIGSTVKFDWTENDKGYKDVTRGSFQVLEEATPAKSTATKAATQERTTSTNASIENQVALKCAVEFAVTFEASPDDALSIVSKAYRTFSGLLHPTSTLTDSPAKPTAKKKVVEPEDENQDPDY